MAGPARLLFNTVLLPSVRVLLPLAARLHPGVGEVFEARRGALERWRAAARANAGRPRVWVHVGSAGEALQAQPLIEAVRARLPAAALFASWWSPSAKSFMEGWPVDYADAAPFAAPRSLRDMVQWLAPDALLLVGPQTMPNFVWAASDAGVPVGQVGCRLGERARAGKIRWPRRALIREVYRHFTAVAAPREEDAEWARANGVPREAVDVTGDPRVDATFARMEDAGPAAWPRPSETDPVLVAGSVHDGDTAVLLPAIARLRARHPGLVAFVAPRDPTPSALRALETSAEREGLSTGRVSRGAGEPRALLIVDSMGILSRMYAAADVAFVGGAFHGSVHNTMEPAVHGVPVVIGPRPGGFHEVEDLRRAGALRSVATVEDLEAALEAWLGDPDARARAGRAGRATMEQHRGATARTIAFLSARGFPVG